VQKTVSEQSSSSSGTLTRNISGSSSIQPQLTKSKSERKPEDNSGFSRANMKPGAPKK